MHVEINSDCVICIGIVTFRYENENVGKFGIAIQCTDALDDIPIEDLECLARYDDLAPNEPWPP